MFDLSLEAFLSSGQHPLGEKPCTTCRRSPNASFGRGGFRRTDSSDSCLWPAQEPVGTHTVVKEDTLWDLAQRYYSNPFEWRVIWNANRDVVEDPNWIYPAEVIVIPGLPGDTQADEPAQDPIGDRTGYGRGRARGPCPVWTSPGSSGDGGSSARSSTRTLQGRWRRAMRPSDIDYAPVSSDAVYSAPWMIGLMMDPAHDRLEIAGFADGGSRSSSDPELRPDQSRDAVSSAHRDAPAALPGRAHDRRHRSGCGPHRGGSGSDDRERRGRCRS